MRMCSKLKLGVSILYVGKITKRRSAVTHCLYRTVYSTLYCEAIKKKRKKKEFET